MDSTKKDLILQTALELFSEYGTQQTTMDAIANDCEISKKQFTSISTINLI